ncbi:MAG: hypothetical protein ACE5I7_13395, partial [Candidatus Binatia bacterium]
RCTVTQRRHGRSSLIVAVVTLAASVLVGVLVWQVVRTAQSPQPSRIESVRVSSPGASREEEFSAAERRQLEKILRGSEEKAGRP